MGINANVLSCVILILSALFGGVKALRRQQSSDILLASSILSNARLTQLVTDQADKIVAIRTELDESKAENKKLLNTINTLEGKIEEYDNLDETKAEIEELRSDLFAKIEVLEVKQNKTINGTRKEIAGLRSDLYAKIEVLEVEQNKTINGTRKVIAGLRSDLSAKIEILEEEQAHQKRNSSDLYAKIEILEVERNKTINGTKTDIEELKVKLTDIASYKNDTKTDMKSLEIELKQTIAGVKTDTSSEISDVLAKVEEISWPEGSYCILGSGGSCPEGFTRYQGWSKAIWTYANNGYTKAVTFGDSSIGCNSGCSRSSNYWNVDIIITSCCK